MFRTLFILLLLSPAATMAQSWFDGNPDFADDASKQLAFEVLAAHGGMQAMNEASGLEFNFFTKMIGNPTPFYSIETLNPKTGDAYVDWPFWNATITWDRNELWTRNWPMPLPAGFFVRLTSSFITLPWQMHANNANVGPVRKAKLPRDDTEYDVLRITYDDRNPGIPGTFYEIFIHPETRLMAGIRFDINHPGMVANPSQPLGPNYHVFGDYRNFDGLVIPTFYKSFGQGSSDGGKSNAYHFVWNFRSDQPFDSSRLEKPGDASVDTVSSEWWQDKSSGSAGGAE